MKKMLRAKLAGKLLMQELLYERNGEKKYENQAA